MSHYTEPDHERRVVDIDVIALRALELREMAFEFGDASLIKSVDLMLYCVGKAVARRSIAVPAGIETPASGNAKHFISSQPRAETAKTRRRMRLGSLATATEAA